jgi:hypothetical protein
MSHPVDDILALEDPTQFAIALSNHVYSRQGGEGLTGLTEAEQTVFCIDGVEREVNNGGFSQFFYNSAGEYARETVDALRRIGATATADLVVRAMEPFGKAGPSREWEERRDQLERIGDAAEGIWQELDDAFLEYPDDLSGLMRTYVREHRDQFSA